MSQFILVPVVLLTSWFSGFTGMGGGILLLSAMTFILPWQTLIPVHGLVQIVSNGSRALFLARYVNWKLFNPFVAGVPFGGFMGYFVIQEIGDTELPLLLVCAVIIYTIFKPKKLPALKLPPGGFFFLGVAAGLLGLLVGATGPFLAPFFLRDDLNRQNIVATKALCQIVTHIIKVPVFLMLDFAYGDYTMLVAGMCVSAVIGTRLGVKTLKYLSEKNFRIIFKIALGAAALRLLWKVFT